MLDFGTETIAKLIWVDKTHGHIIDAWPTETRFSINQPMTDVTNYGSTRWTERIPSGYQEIQFNGHIKKWTQFDPQDTLAVLALPSLSKELAQKSIFDTDKIAEQIMNGKFGLTPANLSACQQSSPEPVAGYWINPQKKQRKGRTQAIE